MSSVGKDLVKLSERKDTMKTCALCGEPFWPTAHRGRPRMYCSVRRKDKACKLGKKK